MVVVTMEEEVRGVGVGGKVMGVRVVKQEVVEVVEEGGEGCLGTGGGMRVEEESAEEGRVEEVGEEVKGVDVGGVKMGNEEEGVDWDVLDDLGREEDEEGGLDDLEEEEEEEEEMAEAEGFESGGNCERERAGVVGAGDGEGEGEAQAGDLELRRLVAPATRSLSNSQANGTMSKFLPMFL